MTSSTTQYLFPSLIAIALAGAAVPALAEEAGFVEGAKVNLNLRNFYINRNFTNPTKSQGKAEEWTQSFILQIRVHAGHRRVRHGRTGVVFGQARRR